MEWEQLDSKYVLETKFLKVRQDLVKLPNVDKYLIKIFNKDIFVRGYEQRDDGEIWNIKLTENEYGVLGPISD